MIGHSLVVADTATGFLRVLNPSASALWLLAAEGQCTVDALALRFACLFGLEPDRANADVAACLEQWRAFGWLETGTVGLAHGAAPMAAAAIDRLVDRDPDAPLPEHTVLSSRVHVLRDTPFRVTLATGPDAGFEEILPRVGAFLTGFPVMDAAAEGEVLMIVGRDEIVVRWPGGTVATGDGSAGVARLVLAIYQLAYPREAMVATLHAAALNGPCGTILMPGRSGNGKSTLSAYLAGQGWRYLADDSIGLASMGDGRWPTVLPFPSAVGLKPGTWPVLAPLFPAIGALPVVPYAGKTARFLDLTTLPLPTREACVPRAIVFPCYEAGHPGTLRALEPAEAMVGVAEAGLRTGETLDSGRIDAVLAFLEAVPSHAMTFGDLAWAERTLAAL